MFSSKKILIGISGSIAAFKVAHVISDLRKKNWEVRTIATPSALKFIGEATLEGLSGHPVLTSDFTPGHMMSHIELARWADVFLIAPATAKTLCGLATGTGDGILFSTYLAYEPHKPLLIAPAMNTQMLAHPATQTALNTLSQRGSVLLKPNEGLLACGEIGSGRMQEPDEVVSAIEQSVISTRLEDRVLITLGGTRVPLDGVRSITNTSTGRTGSVLADELVRRGYNVTVFAARSAQKPRLATDILEFDTFFDLQKLLEIHLSTKKYKTIIHMAAVSDFILKAPSAKIPSGQPIDLHLTPTPKLISQIHQQAPSSHLIGFKLTVNATPENVENSVNTVFNNGAHAVIHNDLNQMSDTHHRFTLYLAQKASGSVNTEEALVQLIERSINSHRHTHSSEVIL